MAPPEGRPSATWRRSRVALLGSTGSIGRQTVDVLAAAGPGRLPGRARWPRAATPRRSAQQARRAPPAVVALADPDARGDGSSDLGGADARSTRTDALVEMAVA